MVYVRAALDMSTLGLQIGSAAMAFLLAWLLAELVRRSAAALKLVQVPNLRSSHAIPTPSGGGVSIAIVGTLAGLALAAGDADVYFFSAIGLSALAAVMGLLDDRFELSARLRLALQCVIVVTLVILVGTLPPLATPFGSLPQPLLLLVLVLSGIWWVNLFNFMDGIDGIAGAEAIFVLAGAVTLGLLAPDASGFGTIPWWALCVGAATAGFLVLNWPPARIFMGDAGSNYLAVVMLAILLSLLAAGLLTYPAAVILVALFVTDASMTLLRRMVYRQRWFAAHRLHAYQKLSRRWKSHRRVTLLYAAINIVWLYPLAYLAQFWPGLAWFAVLAAYLPLSAFCWAAGAGKPEPTTATEKDSI